MDIRFIGTGSGRISPGRFHSSVLISASGYNLLIDTGDSVSRALISRSISFNFINGILISHLHPDHFSGFASLIVQMQMIKRTEPLYIFIHHTLIKKIKDFLTLSYVFLERMNFPINIMGFDFDSEVSVTQDLKFIGKMNSHLKDYEKYDTTLSFACSSFLFRSKGKYVFYSGDIGSADDLFLFQGNKIDIFITEAAHVSTDSIINMSETLKPGKVIITHIDEEDIGRIRMILENTGGGSIIIVEDVLTLSV